MPQGRRSRNDRPAKPYPDFPLFPHATGRWAKKIRGRFAFFGPWNDPDGALDRYLAQRDELHAGRVPRTVGPRSGARAGAGPGAGSGAGAAAGGTSGNGAAAGLALKDLANHFLTAKQRRLEAGEMGRRSFSDYHATAARMIRHLGKHRLIDDLVPDDFARFRSELAKARGPVALGNEVGRVRSIFKHGFDAGLLDRPVRFGPEFSKPPKRSLRLAKRAKGEKMFEAAEVRTLLENAGLAMRAMILLGVNCGLGNTDVADLTRTMLDLDKGTLEFPRPKTGIPRRAVLWPETVKAIRAWLKVRPKPGLAADKDLVFVTKYGHRWVRVGEPGARSKGRTQAVVKDAVVLEFGKLTRATGVHREGRGFYGLRHTFRTVADEVGDRPAVDLIMGHENGADIATHYVERIGEERLRKVTTHVQEWVFPRRRLPSTRTRTSAKH
jgi:integrase